MCQFSPSQKMELEVQKATGRRSDQHTGWKIARIWHYI